MPIVSTGHGQAEVTTGYDVSTLSAYDVTHIGVISGIKNNGNGHFWELTS